MQDKYITVTQLTRYIKYKIDGDANLNVVFLKGEISNFKAHTRGHFYFTLKDDNSRINAVMFASRATKMKFMPQDGMKVMVTGKVSVYEATGGYQIYVDEMVEDGIGNLYIAFEQLKEKLAKEGLFNPEFKKPIPKYPKVIGIVTAPTGAAIRDILSTIHRRWPLTSTILFPALVQGKEGAQSIAKQIEVASTYPIDVLIVGRGGGSIEDLWCFNEEIVARARKQAYSAINSAMVEAYWKMGKRIVEEEQQGQARADYGKQLLKSLSKALTEEFGKGFSVNSLYYYRQFYQAFPEKLPTVWGILTWSHYKRLLSVSDPKARTWYLKEAAEQMWSYRTLDRNIGSQYYHRLLLSQHKEAVEEEMKSQTRPYQQADQLEFIKNPTVAEFIGLSPNSDFTETDLESAIIDNLQKFLLELGKGFSFVARQKLVRTEKRDYFIDLVFYNYLLKCFVLIDLKTSPITHQDVGQMDMYVRIYDERMRGADDNPTIGIVLCSETDEDIARYSVLHDSNRLFASKFMLYMPTEEELRAEINRQKDFYRLQHGGNQN